VEQLARIERQGGEGTVVIGRGARVDVTNLAKVYFPEKGYTKGDLMRYYTSVAPRLLPLLADRPLALKRYPNGIKGPSFFQQKAPEDPPPGVRVARVAVEDEGEQPRFVGGDLVTLLYTVQLGTIAVHPWHSRLRTLDAPDYAILDLDPGPRAAFARVVEVARWVGEALATAGLRGALKTSGATGIHIGVPLPAGTNEEAARLLAELVATHVAHHHPRDATIVRAVAQRPPTAVYVDYLQNIRGKTVAAAYSARAVPGAVVSAPLRWEELTEDLDPRAFTIATMPARLAEVGDLWAPVTSGRNSLRRLTRA
jgi:bifunctional non-homologous end joining protein LigD